ncbi:glycerophosphodiester phosphodiesterase domain-containing protein 5-like isoform X2 [Mizuhopecten yessoensis]|uniref:glycerophosphodiester phosphodiesterase domain-containing protein 5-like isoform X2 n=1 Tax=Mizuhopecten yessoensis TaxID=6573 RepID=UPI000B457A89|nr:glycerophosphodiester phosphodiesterase domain-containing protein 5-like isoform X2 [Mizuhopecten yessoensis]
MVTHAKLQYYRHNYGLVCITGSLGCRWHRYKQSLRDNRKMDFCVFGIMSLTFLFLTFLLYVILISRNNFDDFNWFMYKNLNNWAPYFIVLLSVICILFTYITILMLLSLCHIIHGHQLYVHPVHVIFIFFCLACCIAGAVSYSELWATEWFAIWLSLKVIGPFLQIGSVILMTSISYVIIGQWFTLTKWYLQMFWLCVYLAVMVGLYISPVFIDSPCVVATTKLPPKPFIIGHRGASGIAPENTMISFEIADQYGVLGYEADVRISFDGVPFLLHDSTFARTTNIANVFPDLIKTDCSMFNISQIQQLDAGSWFVETDPMVTMSSVSSKNKVLYKQQKIPTLLEFLKFANKTGKVVVFDFLLPSKSHPFYSDMGPFHNAIHESGIDPKTVWWLMSVEDKLSEGYTPVVREYSPPDVLRQKHIYNTNIEFSSISIDQIREYRANNITTNIHTVNKGWFLSLFWCVGTTSISTNNCHTLSQMERPVWTLLPRNYLILWVTVDVLSAILVIVIFIVQSLRMRKYKYTLNDNVMSNNSVLETGSRDRAPSTVQSLSLLTGRHRASKFSKTPGVTSVLIATDVTDGQ